MFLALVSNNVAFTQDKLQSPVIVNNDDIGQGLKFFASGQIWLRYTQLNPGSKIGDEVKNGIADISVRRFRLAFKGRPSKRWYLKIQMGLNNLNYLNSDLQLRLLDLLAVYEISDWLSFGIGKNGYTGPSRYASVASTSALGVDIPIFAISTVNISDDLTRKLSVFAKGTIGKLGYRIVMAKPNRVKKNVDLSEYATFKDGNPHLQTSAYVKYQFLERELRESAYMPGTYFGAKRVVNFGAGFLYQKNATSRLAGSDTLSYDMFQFAADLFVDLPLNAQNSQSLTFYGGYFNTNFGAGYLRNIGVNNPASESDGTSLNGVGNAYPAIGTGSVFYGQIGIRMQFKKKIAGIKAIQPYLSIQNAKYDRLNKRMILLESGFSLLSIGHYSKLTFGIQNRPIYMHRSDQVLVDRRSNMFVLQYQFKIT